MFLMSLRMQMLAALGMSRPCVHEPPGGSVRAEVEASSRVTRTHFECGYGLVESCVSSRVICAHPFCV